jgi:ActR/RegA family two-component response regulator
MLSHHEIETFFHGLPRAAGSELSAPRPRAGVLIVTRNERDLQSWRSALETRSLPHTSARNPFTALDHLRWRDFAAVVTDYELWSGRGAMLFERLAKLEHAVDVIFICEGGGEDAEGARRTPALKVLERPLEREAIEQALEEMLARRGDLSPASDSGAASSGAGAAAGNGSENGRDDGNRGAAPLAAPAPEPVTQPVPEPARDHAPEPPLAPGREPELASVQRWYRFFFEARRQGRELESPEARWGRILDLFVEAQGGGAAALVAAGPAGESWRVLGLKSSHLPGENRDDLKRRLQSSLVQLRQPLGDTRIEDAWSRLESRPLAGETRGAGAIYLFPGAERSRRALVAIAPAASSGAAGAPLPQPFDDELLRFFAAVELRSL